MDVARSYWVVVEETRAPPSFTALRHRQRGIVGSGLSGHGKRPGMMIGSVSLEIVQHANVPVVVFPGVSCP